VLAVEAVAAVLLVLLRDWLKMPPRLYEVVLAAVLCSTYSRARELRHHLTVATALHTDLDHLFEAVLPPPFWAALIADLEHEGLLTHPDRCAAEECLLAVVDASGHWKNDDGPRAA
jgi:hypothetical protein